MLLGLFENNYLRDILDQTISLSLFLRILTCVYFLLGGGPKPAQLSVLTEAVVDVVGRKSQTLSGIALSEDMDSSRLLIKQQSVCSPQQPGKECSPQQPGKESLGDSPGGSESTIDVICCACKCHRKLEALKEEKLKLQIKYYERKLVENSQEAYRQSCIKRPSSRPPKGVL
ncbi:hypothetical protein DPMN_099753 [Dreissena polymorpha]|uniref:Uncharacterized protein n=1 Tax=Dreissena polymorpha TaxID=45954 RepID=A0A9D4LEP2_DREPO|nr:hypothetical protein DPMN_099753 [Dreissena polymorpha]